MLGLAELPPLPPLLGPPVLLLIASRLDEFQELTVGNQVLRSLEASYAAS